MTATLDPTKEVFIVNIAYFDRKILIYLAKKTLIALLLAKKVSVWAKYLDFTNVFLKKLVVELFKHFTINKYFINLELGKKLFYNLISSLKLVDLEIFNIYIEINLANIYSESN